MQEQQPQGRLVEGTSNQEQGDQQHFKTIAIRVEEGVHTQLRFIAQLSRSSITEEIRQAIEHRITTAHDDPELIARAQLAREEIEREATARSAAIAGFMGNKAVAASSRAPGGRRATKPSGE